MLPKAVNAAKSELQMSSAAQTISKSINVNDALIQLTKNHFDGSILKRGIYEKISHCTITSSPQTGLQPATF